MLPIDKSVKPSSFKECVPHHVIVVFIYLQLRQDLAVLQHRIGRDRRRRCATEDLLVTICARKHIFNSTFALCRSHQAPASTLHV